MIRFRFFYSLVAILICLFLAMSKSQGGEPVEYREAYRQHTETGRPMLVLLSSQGCPPCTVLKRDLLFPRLAGRTDSVVTVVEFEKDEETYQAIKTQGGVAKIPALILFRRYQRIMVKENPTSTDLDYMLNPPPSM